MGKIILSLPFLGEQFTQIALEHADRLADEKGLNKEDISLSIRDAKTAIEFKEVFKQYFGEELKLIVN